MDLKILYEDEDVLAVDKPSGISVHRAPKDDGEDTVADWMAEHYPESKNVGESLGDIARPGVVHRLDRETSGVMLLAKTDAGYQSLKQQFQDRTIKKIYRLVVSGFLKLDHGSIDKPIGRSPRDFRRRLAGRGARGEMREALTEYRVIERFIDESGNKFTYVDVRPKTGRTHQIRVHMKYLNHPVAGDDLYNPNHPNFSKFQRLALHAYSIEFKDTKGRSQKVKSPLPEEFLGLKKV